MKPFSSRSKHLAMPLSRARLAGRLPTAWRLWPIGFALALAGSGGQYGLPLLALAGLLGVWECLGQTASSYSVGYDRSSWWDKVRRTLAFTRGLSIVCGFVLFAVLALDATLQPGTWRLPALVLCSAGVGSWLVWRMFRQWWVGTYAVVASVTVIAAALFGIHLTQGAITADLGGPTLWARNFTRLVTVFAVAGAFELLSARSPVRKRNAEGIRTLLAPTMFFVALLALVIPESGALRAGASIDWSGRSASIALLGAATAFTLYRARLPIARDLRWYQRIWSSGWSGSGGPSAGISVATALTPAIALSALASWSAWWIVLGLGAGALMLRAFPERPSRRRRATESRSRSSGQAMAVATVA